MILVFNHHWGRLDACLYERQGVGEALLELLEIFFIEEQFVLVKIELARIVVENLTAFGDGDELVAAASGLHVEEIAAFAGGDDLRVEFFFFVVSVFHNINLVLMNCQ